jgi:hypothetical protein
LRRTESTSAVDSLFFWHQSWSKATKHLVAAVSFALLILLVTPWGRATRLLRRLAILPALVFVLTLVSALLTSETTSDAVVIRDGGVLRSADSSGAPAALTQPLPRGAEVEVLEARDDWTHIQLADGNEGWVLSGTVARVQPE